MTESFRQQVVVITGASDGIGRELARQLADEGAWLALASRSPEKLAAVAQECQDRGGRALVIPTDVGEATACRKLIDETVQVFGRLHMLINNAGISMYARFADLRDPGLMERLLRVNFLGAMYCTGYALPALKQTQGRILVVSSLAAKILAPGASGYAASKAALGSFFSALRTELRSERVSVTVAYPGFVRTDIFQRFLDAEGKPGPDRTSRIPPWTMLPVEQCARRLIEAARRRRKEATPTLPDRLILAVNRFAPWLVERFWQRTLQSDFPS